MQNFLCKDVALPSSGSVLTVVLLSSVERVELDRVEMLFSPFVKERLSELSTDLCGEVNSNNTALSGDHGLQRRKLLPKPRARMVVYRVSCNAFNFTALTLDAPLKAYHM